MAESPFSIEWRRPTAPGYRIVELRDATGHSQTAIEQIGGEDIVYDPLKFEALHRTFAAMDSAAGVVVFANRYGLLSRVEMLAGWDRLFPDYPKPPILVDLWLRRAEQVRSILAVLRLDGAAAAIEALDQAMTERSIPTPPPKFLPEIAIPRDGLDAPSYRLRVVQSPKRHEQRITVQPTDLLSVIYLMLAREIAEGRDYRLCEMPGCNNWFTVGKHTGHRRHRKYCSDRCRVAAHRLRAKPIQEEDT